jgi:hypothetical protein
LLIDTLLPILKAKLELLDGGRTGHPVVYAGLQFFPSADNQRRPGYHQQKFHIVGDLMVTPFSLLRDMLAELNMIVEA